MRLTCPSCGAAQSLDVAIAHAAAREALVAAFGCPAPLGTLLIRYLALFRQPSRALSFVRVDRLLNELLPMIKAGRIERHGRAWSAPMESWRLALEQMVDGAARLTLPLKSHGYLLEIIAGNANQGEAKTENAREAKRAGVTPIAAQPTVVAIPESPPLPITPPAVRQAGLKRIKEALGGIGQEKLP